MNALLYVYTAKSQDLRGGRLKVAYSLPFDRLRTDGRVVLSDYDLFVFALAEGKNEKNKNIKVPLTR
jgi:hypothetical protein